MIIWILIGIILQWIGKILKRSDVLFLGYYLVGTGKTRALPEFSWNTIVDELFDIGINNDEFEICCLRNGMIFTTLGKFWVRVEDGCFIIKDRYMFYPVCDDADIHFSDCNCGCKAYTELFRAKFFNYETTKKLYKTPLKKIDISIKLGKHASIFIDMARIGYTINDEFWVDKGKPFDVYSVIPVIKI